MTNDDTNQKAFISYKEIKEQFGIDKRTVQRWLHSGKISETQTKIYKGKKLFLLAEILRAGVEPKNNNTTEEKTKKEYTVFESHLLEQIKKLESKNDDLEQRYFAVQERVFSLISSPEAQKNVTGAEEQKEQKKERQKSWFRFL